MVRHLQPLVTGLALAETLDRLVNIVEGLKIYVGPPWRSWFDDIELVKLKFSGLTGVGDPSQEA